MDTDNELIASQVKEYRKDRLKMTRYELSRLIKVKERQIKTFETCERKVKDWYVELLFTKGKEFLNERRYK